MSRTVVLLSVLILAVVGALSGYVLGLRDIDENKSLAGDDPSAVSSAEASAGSPAVRRATGDCPQFISAAAKLQDAGVAVPLKLVQYLRTDADKEAWICRESDGTGLWYQGHDRKPDWYSEGEIPVEGQNGLLRPGVVEDAKNRTYSVTNNGTTYVVSLKGLKIGNSTYGVAQLNPPA
ncbi:hypothetical protein Dvina_46680 [Dactylosporangium vinaceum]|uniref:Secreted protein n=1 Tax=Dactylosporangium vinaceum TaxID=53362 RepID=A0ABV5M7N7_9ACTN|nr:hypothetical protein [Dactylosporangium vinaceum]UAB95431.1 hypothetical protein Dvina_46680 [Dactylosporangium vinaceum]